MSLREIPENEREGESYERWLFETRRKEWEAEEQQQGGGSDEEAPSGPPR